MCAFHLEFVELYILLQSTNEYCCKSHFIIGPSLLLAVSYLCLIVKLLNQEVVGACTKAHVLNHPASTFSCILMSVVGMPLPIAGPNAECGSVHIIMHLQPNTSCPPSPAQPSSLDSINPIQSRWRAASSLPIRITMRGHCDTQMFLLSTSSILNKHHVSL